MTFYLKIILVLILNVLLIFLATTDKKMALISGKTVYSKIVCFVFKFNRAGSYAMEFAALIFDVISLKPIKCFFTNIQKGHWRI